MLRGQIEIVATLILNIIQCAYMADHILPCDPNVLQAACPGPHQICNQTTKLCFCDKGFSWVSNDCKLPQPEEDSGYGVAANLAIILTLTLILCGLILVVKKYNLVEYVHKKINLRRNTDVAYEDVMIGQDDPPLSP